MADNSAEIVKTAHVMAKKFLLPTLRHMIKSQTELVAAMEIAIFNARRHLEIAEPEILKAKHQLGVMLLEADEVERGMTTKAGE